MSMCICICICVCVYIIIFVYIYIYIYIHILSRPATKDRLHSYVVSLQHLSACSEDTMQPPVEALLALLVHLSISIQRSIYLSICLFISSVSCYISIGVLCKTRRMGVAQICQHTPPAQEKHRRMDTA